MNASSSGNPFMGLYCQRELSQDGARKFVDIVQTARLSSIQLSTSLEIRAQQRSGANCLAIEAIEYRYLLSGGINGVVTLYDLETVCASKGKSIVQPLLEAIGDAANRLAMISSVQWYPEDTGAFVVSSMSGLVSIFDTNQFVPVVSFAFENNVVHACSIGQSPNIGTSIAVALQDGTIRLCDPRTRDSSHIFKGHSRAATCVAWDPSAGSHLLASAGMDGAVRVWDVRKAGGLKEAAVRSLDWRGDFTSNARVNTKKLHTSLLPLSSHTSQGATRIREGHQHFNSALHNTDTSDSSIVGKAHDNGVMSLRYTSCGNYLVTSGNDQKVRLWGAHTGQLSPTNFSDKVVPASQLPYDIGIAEFSYASSDVLIVPTIANAGSNSDGAGQGGGTTSDGDILLIPLHCSDGRPVKVLKGHLDRVTAIAYRKPQQQIISAGKDGMIFVWGPPDHHHNDFYKHKSGGEAEERRQQRLFYGTTGGRYDYQQVLDSFDTPATAQTQQSSAQQGSSNEASSSSAGPISSVFSALRVLPRTEIESRGGTGQGSAPSSGKQSTTADGGDADGSCSSGDDWSEDELEPQAPPDSSSTARSGKRKLSAVLRQADGSVQSSSTSAAEQGTSSVTAGTPGLQARTSRSFVPPIIAHYLQDAQRSTIPRASSGSSSSVAQVNGAPIAVGLTGGGSAATAGASWQDVDSLFAAPSPLMLPSATMPVAHSASSSGGSGTGNAAAPGRAATASAAIANRSVDDVREADRRYSQWVKQMRGKGKAGSSTKKK